MAGTMRQQKELQVPPMREKIVVIDGTTRARHKLSCVWGVGKQRESRKCKLEVFNRNAWMRGYYQIAERTYPKICLYRVSFLTAASSLAGASALQSITFWRERGGR